MKEFVVVETNKAGNGVSALLYARALGYRTLFVTSDPGKYDLFDPNPVMIADYVIITNTLSATDLLCDLSNRAVAALMTFDDFHVIPVAMVANCMGVWHPTMPGLINVRYKDRFRRVLAHCLNSVRFHTLSGDEVFTESPVGLPCIIKPVDGSGSVGVKVCSTSEDFRQSVRAFRDCSSGFSGYKYKSDVLVEEYIEGEEFSAEMIWDRHVMQWHFLGFTKKVVGGYPYCIEYGHVFPYEFDAHRRDAIKGQIVSALSILNLNGCSVHVEFKWVDQLVKLIEINPRPAGGHINTLVALSLGRDLVSYDVDLYLGRPLIITEEYHRYAAIYYAVPPRPGVIDNLITPASKPQCGFFAHDPLPRELQAVASGDDRIGYVVSCGDTRTSALGSAKQFISKIHYHYGGDDNRWSQSEL